MSPTHLYRIEKMNYVFGALASIAGFILLPQDAALGLLVGAGIGAINFSLIRALVQRLFAAVKDGSGARSAALIFPKMLGLLAAVGIALFVLPISPIYLAIGFSIMFISIAVETVRFLMFGKSQDSLASDDYESTDDDAEHF